MAIAINKVAVIGSGVMGSGIAAHLANAGCSVILFDIPVTDQEHKSSLSRQAIKNLLNNPLKPLMSKNLVNLITSANLEDDLKLLNEVDWVIEVVIEKLDIKKDLYNKILPHLKENCIISSNTSTIPLSKLTEGMNKQFCENFLITHFFNPPRYLTLLELVASSETRHEVVTAVSEFLEVKLGKDIVNCKDTPGFIANRIGCYWLEYGLRKAIQENVSINLADNILHKYLGIPKTGIFGLWDLIGIDLMPLISKSIVDNLNQADDYVKVMKEETAIIPKMIENGLLGRKAKKGFYRVEKLETGSQNFILDFKSGNYIKAEENVSIQKFDNLRDLFEFPANYSRFAWKLMAKTLNYAASLIPNTAFSLYDVDMAMKNGYGWKYGPFELIDMLSDKNTSGAEWLRIKLEIANVEVAPIIKQVGNQKFYRSFNNKLEYFYTDNYLPVKQDKNKITLSDLKYNKKPIYENDSAKLWDVEDNTLCIELTKKMPVLDREVFNLIEKSVELLNSSNFIGLIIYNDSDNFCAGADVKEFIKFAEEKNFKAVEEFIDHGQKAMLALKNSKKPIVSALKGAVLGGGAEIALHSDAIVAFAELKMGLVETNIGLVPGWGGCKEMFLKSFFSVTTTKPTDEIVNNFNLIRKALVSDSAINAKEIGYLQNYSKIIMNKKYLLSESKKIVLELSHKNKPIKESKFYMEISEIRDKLEAIIKQDEAMQPHEKFIAKQLLKIFTNNNNSNVTEESLLALEKNCFLELIKTEETLARMKSMINDKKVLKN